MPTNATSHGGLTNPERVKTFSDEIPEDVFLYLAETFQALGDASRVKIVWALSKGELSVSEIADLFKMNQPAVSHHLRTLRNLKLVKTRRDGRNLFYTLDDHHIENLLNEGMEHVEDFL